MASRPILSPFLVITNGDMSKNETSTVTIIQNLSHISYGISWAGASPVGTVSVQVSNDYAQNAAGVVSNPGTWTSLYLNVNGTPSTTVAISGNTGQAFLDITATSAYAMRLVYTYTSGTGSLQATIAAKVG